jgi:hypothetical protein
LLHCSIDYQSLEIVSSKRKSILTKSRTKKARRCELSSLYTSN